MFKSISRTINKISEDIKEKTENAEKTLTDKISDISDAVQDKTDAVSKSVGSLFDSEKTDAPVNIDIEVEDVSEYHSFDADSIVEADDIQQHLTNETNMRIQEAEESYQILEGRRKKQRGKRIAAIIAGVVVTGSAISIGADITENAAMAESYDKAVSYIMSEEYDLAVSELTEVTVDDAEALSSYAYVQSRIDDYAGKPAAMLEELQEVDSITNSDVKRQQKLACEDLTLAEEIQEHIDSLDLSSVDTISKGEMSVIETQSNKLDDRYKVLLATEKYDLASRVLENVESKNEAGQLIAEIDNLGDISLDSKDKIDELKSAYNNLSSSDKETILNYSTLTSAENTYAKLRKEEDARIAAEKKAEEKRLAAEKKAEEERKAAEEKAEQDRLAAAAREEESSGTMVWIPRTGSKYHSSSSCSNMKNPSQVTLEEAERLGYEPCKKCY